MMSKIERNPEEASRLEYDLIIVGGGVYGVCLSLEAARMGKRPLLVEKGDFGGRTSFNSLRILHGGLRYLQSFNFKRFNESVSERSWFLRTFPELVQVLPCLMPLYGKGAKRPSIFRAALLMNDFMSRNRNIGICAQRQLPSGCVIDSTETEKIFPAVDTKGLKGGAVWYDVSMPDSQRLLIELLRWASDLGVTALNYVEATDVLVADDRVGGIKAFDCNGAGSYEFKAKAVVNAAGPWCRQFAAKIHKDIPHLFRPSLAWNVLFDRPALSDHALAVAPKKPGGRTYFLVPWKGQLMAGTGHATWSGSPENPKPSDEQLGAFIADLNLAIPSLNLNEGNVQHVLSGLLPAEDDDSVQISTSEEIISHSDHGGPKGFYSVSGVKFTTARLVAQKTLSKMYPQAAGATEPFRGEIVGLGERGIFDLKSMPAKSDPATERHLMELLENESVVEDEDLLFRRSNLWESSECCEMLKPVIRRLKSS